MRRSDECAPRQSGLRRLPRAHGSDRLRDGEFRRRRAAGATRDAGNPIDASGVLPDGTKFNGVAGLKKALLRHPEQFVTTVAEKLLMYAIGAQCPVLRSAGGARNRARRRAPATTAFASLV